jgi:hypothetical protein
VAEFSYNYETDSVVFASVSLRITGTVTKGTA